MKLTSNSPDFIWADQDNLTWVEANPDESMKDCEVVYIRADLCASGQQVRALVVDDLAQIIRVVDGNNILGAGELAEAILETMPAPRIVGALTPAPQEPEAVRHSFDGDGWLYADRGNGSDWLERAMDYPDAEPLYTAPPPQPSKAVAQEALKLSPEYQALFDEVKQRAQPEQKAVPVGWITQPYPGVKWSFSFHEPKALPEGWIARPLYTHPPQPSETVAEALKNMMAFARSKMDDPSRADDMRIFKDAEAALRALKGEEANG